MADGYLSRLREAREEAYSTPIDQIDVSLGERFRDDTIWPFFERLRHEAPVHYAAESRFGPWAGVPIPVKTLLSVAFGFICVFLGCLYTGQHDD